FVDLQRRRAGILCRNSTGSKQKNCDCSKPKAHGYSSPVFVSKSASVSLCFGFAAAFSLTVGSGNELFGVPTRSRALALTAFVTENVFFFDFAITSPFSTRLLAYSTPVREYSVSVGGLGHMP